MKRTYLILLMTFSLLMTLCPSASATGAAVLAESDNPSPAALEFLRKHPGGALVGHNEVADADGTGFVAIEVGTMSVSQCGSGRFCTWSSPSYTGSFTYTTGTNVTRTLGRSVKSFWNNRSQAARLYNNAGSASTCYAAGTKKSSLAVAYQTPAKVYLSAGTAC